VSEDRPPDAAAELREIASALDAFADHVHEHEASSDPEPLDRALRELRAIRNRSFGRRPDWHRIAIGGAGSAWERGAGRVYEFLRDAGLEPAHFLLDIGCGSLRAGSRLIPYLEPGHYVGVDRDAGLIEAGLAREIPADVASAKRPRLEVMDDFAFDRLGRRFDFAIAYYVFPALALNSIMRCLVGVGRVLAPDGRFYATFFENPDKRNLEPIQRPGALSLYDAPPYHYDVATLACACRGTGLELADVADWTAGGQRLLVYRPA
jgi:SAM-dependent methyltransferase